MAAMKHLLRLALAVAIALTLYPGCTPGGAPPTEQADSALPAPAAPAASTAPVTAGDPVAAIAEPPAMPAGYGSTVEAMAAVAKGDIPLLDDNPPVPDGVKELAGLEYGNIDGISLKLDLALPANEEGPFPGLIFIHGGGWASGKRQIYHLYTYHFARQGYAAATISYRLSGQAQFPAAVQDVKCAVRWMRANAAVYHIDPDRIALIGGSAGGHLALMAGYTAGDLEFEGEGGNPGVSSAVQAVVNFYGPYDLTAEIARDSKEVLEFLGASWDENPALYFQASPMHYLNAGDPPTLIFHGTIDDVVPIEQSERLAARLDELGIPCVFEAFEGWPHTMDRAQPVNDRCRWFMYHFFEAYLRPQAAAGAPQ